MGSREKIHLILAQDKVKVKVKVKAKAKARDRDKDKDKDKDKEKSRLTSRGSMPHSIFHGKGFMHSSMSFPVICL